MLKSIIQVMKTDRIEVQVGELLRSRGMRLAVAESCTGGLISHRITNVPGSSVYYLGGVTSYANEVKIRILGVRPETLERHGAVSRETVLEMARGVRRLLNANVSIAISGIAGPDGGTPEKPVGLTWIGLSAADGTEDAWRYIWPGDRLQVKEQSAEQALKLLAAYLAGDLSAAAHPEQPGWQKIGRVSARFEEEGRVTPQEFEWQGEKYRVESTGRQWQDELGSHVLVMVPSRQVYELLYHAGEQTWYLKMPAEQARRA